MRVTIKHACNIIYAVGQKIPETRDTDLIVTKIYSRDTDGIIASTVLECDMELRLPIPDSKL